MATRVFAGDQLPDALRSNFETCESHPLSELQVDAVGAVQDWFDAAQDLPCVLVLPKGSSSSVVPLLPYALGSQSTMVLASNSKTHKELYAAFVSDKALLVTQGVLPADHFLDSAMPSAKQLTELVPESDAAVRAEMSAYDLITVDLSRAFQLVPTDERYVKGKKQSYEIAPPALLPLGGVDLLIVDGAHLVEKKFEGYISELEENAKAQNPQVRIIHVVAGPPSVKSIELVMTAEETPEDFPTGYIVCGDALPKPRARASKRVREETEEDEVAPTDINDYDAAAAAEAAYYAAADAQAASAVNAETEC